MTSGNAHLIDIAVNLTDNAFEHDYEQVLERARATGVSQLIIPGSSLEESSKAIVLCQKQPQRLFSTAGVHPHYSSQFPADGIEQLRLLCRQSCVKAVGETGLDFNRDFSPRPDQIRVFEQQLMLAAELQYPVLMHERDAHQPFYDLIRKYRDQIPRAVLHCFTGTRDQLFRLLDLDIHIGITGWICDERRGAHLLPLLKEIPSDRLMLETDAPYLLPRDLKPKPKSRRNEPCYLPHICQVAASHLGVSCEQLAQSSSATAKAFFDL
ncbi:MAG: TatD DNase family protein [Motiliproteus sp.]|jgi:TatD DNase family protein